MNFLRALGRKSLRICFFEVVDIHSKNFSTDWQFEYRISSPRYPQANGKVENAVKTCKGLLLKAKEDKRDPLLAILAWRNTPSWRDSAPHQFKG